MIDEKEEEQEELSDEEIFVPEEPEDDDGWTAKPLSLRNSVILIRLFSTVIVQSAMRVDEIITDSGDISEDGLIELLALLDARLVSTVLSIVTELEPEEVEKTFRLDKAIRVLFEFWHLENIGKLLGEVRRLATNQEFQERQGG